MGFKDQKVASLFLSKYATMETFVPSREINNSNFNPAKVFMSFRKHLGLCPIPKYRPRLLMKKWHIKKIQP